jgi:hypothetical protein
MEVIIVRPKIVDGFPGLGDGVELEGMNGLRSPSGLAEMNVGIEGPDIFCVMREPGNPDIQAVFLRPCESRRAHGNMRDAHMLAEIGKIVATRAVGDLDGRAGEEDAGISTNASGSSTPATSAATTAVIP